MRAYEIMTRLLLTSLALLWTTHVQAYQAVPSDNLAYPVLLTLKDGGIGSGFYLNDGAHVYLATARHVLFDESKLSLRSSSVTCVSYPCDPNDPNRIEIELDLTRLRETKQLKYHTTCDAAIACIANNVNVGEPNATNYEVSLCEGVRMLKYAKSGILGLSVANTVAFKHILVANDVFVFGYPASIGLKQLPQIEYDRPLLRKGIIAGKNHLKKTIIIDCPCYPGNSGGLVVQVENRGLGLYFRGVGLVSESVPFAEPLKGTYGSVAVQISNSGYSVVTPIDAVLELLPEKARTSEKEPKTQDKS